MMDEDQKDTVCRYVGLTGIIMTLVGAAGLALLWALETPGAPGAWYDTVCQWLFGGGALLMVGTLFVDILNDFL